MCGIAGLIDPALAGASDRLAHFARKMSDAIAHRGPDGEGAWIDADAGLALGHRRLAIVDLSPSGAQPMLSACGRYAIIYNGEVYNAAEMRAHPALAGIAWRGHSDTEVIIESIARRGLDATLAELNGMFAFAVWDRRTRTLVLVRDRLGIKPLFLAREGRRLSFGSELKSLAAAATQPFTIDPSSVASFLRFGYVPAPHAIWRNVEKLEPGGVIRIAADGTLTRHRYWSAADAVHAGLADPLDLGDEEATERLETLLGDAVSRQMVADVPVGAFLSGGIDSSTVTALMVAAGRGPVHTFSIGFPDLEFDESGHAAAVARHLETIHTEFTVTATEALAVIPELSGMYDEPFADSSQIPTHLVSKLTRAHVKVALSGDGGDELFAGYNRYLLAEGLGSRLVRLPKTARSAAARLVEATPDALIDGIATLVPRHFKPRQPADKLKKFASILPLDAEGLYLRLVSQCPDPEAFVRESEHPLAMRKDGPADGVLSFLDRMQLLDTLTYLPDDILQKVDRASMAVALEVRPPLLDHRILEFVWRLPRRVKIRNGETKWLLRRLLDRFVPRPLIDRPKMGFAIPLADWLRGPLREWADDLLRADAGLVAPTSTRLLWSEHLAGRRNHAYQLWTLLMLEAWRRRWT
ncbi:MAG: asparagine synthase (glutamine-hydrolyzing) [Blastochloris sp.]|nr:asparagine synthase (glutamine-hydrolyzing) [Blastochloris sp.]